MRVCVIRDGMRVEAILLNQNLRWSIQPAQTTSTNVPSLCMTLLFDRLELHLVYFIYGMLFCLFFRIIFYDVGNTNSTTSSENETLGYYPCSMDPFVPCFNIPGTFRCSSCPPGTLRQYENSVTFHLVYLNLLKILFILL